MQVPRPFNLAKTEASNRAPSLDGYRSAKDLKVPVPRVRDILLGKRRISAEMAVLLARYFSTADDYFMRLQSE